MLLKDRYVIERELGRGGFGVVHLARDRQLHQRPVVIKVLLETSGDLDRREWLRKHFRQESEALARINHPGVVGILDTGETPTGELFIVLQFVPGVNLRAAMNPAGMEFRRVADLLRQTGRALAAAHAQGVIHRDLKPENIMLETIDGAEHVRLIDFGIATVRDAQAANDPTATTNIAGTVAYMAPEQLQGRPSPLTDVYALGVIAYEMLTGRLPFNPPSPYQLLEWQRAGVKIKPTTLRRDLPAAAEAVILSALAFEQSDRPPGPRAFTEALADALLGGTPTQPVPQPQPAPPPPALEMAHVLFTDIVGYSKQPMSRQTEWLGRLQAAVSGSPVYRNAQSADRVLSLPTGDGIALVFFGDPVAPLNCALDIARALRGGATFGLRMGIHSGPVQRVADINANRNVAGGGINLAQRVMDCGDAGHILLSRSVADILNQIGDWSEHLRDLGEHEVKHGARLHLFNLCVGELGNPAWPTKLPPREKLYVVDWESAELTQRLVALSGRDTGNLSLRLWVAADDDNATRRVRDFVPDPIPPRFRLGDKGVINVQSARDCYLWVAVIGTTGSRAIIFPRTADADNRVAAGQLIRLPGTFAGAPGTETVHAFASVSPIQLAWSMASELELVRAEEVMLRDKPGCAAITIQFEIGSHQA